MKPKWEFKRSISTEKFHSLLFRDDELGVQMEIHTPFRGGHPKKSETFLFIIGDKREFKTEQELMQALHPDGPRSMEEWEWGEYWNAVHGSD